MRRFDIDYYLYLEGINCAIIFMTIFILVILALAFILPTLASAYSGRVDFGYISNSNGTKSSSFSTELKADRDKLSAEFLGKARYQETKEDNFSDILSTIQTNYTLNKWLGFLNVEYRQDKINGIDDQVDAGAGVGYQIMPDLRIQSGLYQRFNSNGEFLSKTIADYSGVIYGPLSFREKVGYEMNMDRRSDNRFTSLITFKTELGSTRNFGIDAQIFLKAGLDYSRDNEPGEGYPKDIRKWESTIGVEF